MWQRWIEDEDLKITRIVWRQYDLWHSRRNRGRALVAMARRIAEMTRLCEELELQIENYEFE